MPLFFAERRVGGTTASTRRPLSEMRASAGGNKKFSLSEVADILLREEVHRRSSCGGCWLRSRFRKRSSVPKLRLFLVEVCNCSVGVTVTAKNPPCRRPGHGQMGRTQATMALDEGPLG